MNKRTNKEQIGINKEKTMKMDKEQIFLDSAAIMRFFLELDDSLDTLVLCKPRHIQLIATDQGIYEALASIEDRKSINYNKLVKFFEAVDIIPFSYYFKQPRKIITLEDAKSLREKALKHTKPSHGSRTGII